MSKIEEIKNLLVQTQPDSPERERLKRVVEAFFGLRVELIQAIKDAKLSKVNLNELIERRVDLMSSKIQDVDGQVEKELDEVGKKITKIFNSVEADSTTEADEVIETMLKSQDNLRRLATSGQVSNDQLLEALIPSDKK